MGAVHLNHGQRAERYARAVVAGDIVAGEFVRLAAERFIRDIEGGEWIYDEGRAQRVGQFIELMPHVKGGWAQRGELLALEDWQCFAFITPFAFVRKDDPTRRRFRACYHEVARKNAKSTLMAAIGNYMAWADAEFGAEVYCGATSEKQAWEVFGPARQMMLRVPEAVAKLGIEVGARNMHTLGTNSKFEPVIGNPGDGASPHLAIIDELHEHTTPRQLETFRTGTMARTQPLVWAITTAGENLAGPCYQLRQHAVEVLRGTVQDDALWTVIYCADEDDDWASEEALQKANPNLGVSVFADALRDEQRLAVSDPHRQAAFRTKHLCQWVGAANPYLNRERWEAAGDETLDESAFDGQECFAGLDLSAKIDTTSFVRVYRKMDEADGTAHYYVFGDVYLPQERTLGAEGRQYAGWLSGGYVKASGEERIDYDQIEADVIRHAERTNMILGVDPWNATQVITHLQQTMGDEKVVEVPQTVNHLSEPLKELQAAIQAGRVHHVGNPAHTWQIDNVAAKEDHKGNVFPRKARAEKKIDFAVALIVALSMALRHQPAPPSRYESPDAEVLYL